ncbi:hypothetical protein E3U43_011558, partial [Larimichthys crocea]
SLSNGASHIEEEEDEELGGKFQFGDEDDVGPPEMSDWSKVIAVSNPDTKTNNPKTQIQETTSQDMNRTTSIGQVGQDSLVYHEYCSDMEVRESPEG